MFGTLSAKPCALPDERRTEYSRFYCGVCQSLGEHHGLLTRGTLSNDAVLMSLLADALLDVGAEADSCRCPLLPLKIKKTVSPHSVAMRYATAVQMLLGDQWLADRAMDGRVAFRWARSLASGHVRRAQATLDELGVDTRPLCGVEERQAGCEVLGVTGPREAAAPTEGALGFLFAQLAQLPGAIAQAKTPETGETLRRLGAAVGRLIYFIDALEDLKKDLERGEFNPCLTRRRDERLEISPGRVLYCVDSVERDVAALPELLAALPLLRHRAVIEHILCGRLVLRARRAVELGRRLAGDMPRALLAWWRELAWPRRTAYQLAAWVVWLFVWVQLTGSALADKVTGTGKRTQAKDLRDQKSPKGPGGVATRAGSDPLASSPAPDATDHQAEAARLAKDYPGNTVLPSRGGTSGSSPSAKAPEGSGNSGSGSATSSSSSGSSGGSGCSNPCSGCGDSCSSCGDSCSSCGDGCKGCGDSCSSCGDGCKGCDNCCDGCGDCGKCDCGNCNCK